ncbi:MAG: KpsF/GutQ family sugar-phosphate isomerase [Candidatus Omnitrophota bacterium]
MSNDKLQMTNKAKEVLKIECQAIKDLISHVNNSFIKALDLIYNCQGRVVVTGVGKGGIIGQKFSATLSSTGTASLWLHSAEAIHGDLGRIKKEDIVIFFSYSGSTEEITKLVPLVKKIGSKIVSFTGNIKSNLAKYSDIVLNVKVNKEACPWDIVPTSSTTAMLAMSDALAVCLIEKRGFKKEDFAFLHPGGMLGKKLLLKVEDIMRKDEANPIIDENSLVKDALIAITKARAGAATIINKKRELLGIFTDGDLRRHFDSNVDISCKKIKKVMTKNPITINKEKLAAEALSILRDKKIDEIPVVDKNNHPVGMLDVQDLLKSGLV